MKKKVCVLLTTYNPNKYLLEQLDSIFEQQDVECKVIIRDDASPNKEYLYKAKKLYDVHVIEGKKNLGVAKNIRELLRYAYENEQSFDFFAYGDQDDVWMPDKLSVATSALEKILGDCPCLYYSNLLVVDANLRPSHELFRRKIVNNSCKQSLAQVFLFACTSVFNRQMIAAVKDLDFDRIGFDSCIYYMGIWKGRIIYDDTPHILYRQHGNNVSGSKKKGLWALIKKITSKHIYHEKTFQANANFILENFEIPETHADFKMLQLVSEYSNFADRMKIAWHIKAGYFPKDFYRFIHLLIGEY